MEPILPQPTRAAPDAAPVPRRRPRWLRLLLRGAALAVLASLLAVALFAQYVIALKPSTPDARELHEAQSARPSVLLMADGRPLTTLRRVQQEHVPLERISPHVLQALVATEDHRFFEHRGLDYRRLLGALLQTASGDVQGASTITQQLARNLFPEEIGRSRNLNRKLKEMITALRIERLYTKAQILESYLNSAPFFYNVVGIEMAARTYFDKPAAELDPVQSATLVGMLKGTRYYNPVLYPDRARKRRNLVLAQMVKHDILPQAAYAELSAQPMDARLNRQTESLGSAPHFSAHARKWLLEWAEKHDHDLYADGLVIHTTLDPLLQEAATRAVERQAEVLQQVADVEWSEKNPRLLAKAPEAYARQHERVDPFAYLWARRDLVDAFIREAPEFRKAVAAAGGEQAALRKLAASPALMARLKAEKTRLEAGFVAIDPASGEVKAWVGSRDFNRDQYDHVALAERQPGSTFKPFVYGAALESGFSPDTMYLDEPVEVPLADGKVWKPTDMSGASGAAMSLREGLVHSKNSITAQVMQEVGLPRVLDLAQAMGLDRSKLDPVPSLALGTSPVTLLQMVNAYATIAREGRHREPVFIRRITDRHGRVLARFDDVEARRALSTETAVELIDMMRGVVTTGTGTQVKTRFGIAADVAGKTGTTQNNTDGWFILMHPNLVSGAWVGFNDARVTMRSDHWGQGGHNAVLLVGEFFRDALKARLVDAKARFPKPLRLPHESGDPARGDSWAGVLRDYGDRSAPAQSAFMLRRRGGGVIIGDRSGVEQMRRQDEPPRSEGELEQLFSDLAGDNVLPRRTSPRSRRAAGEASTVLEAQNSLPEPGDGMALRPAAGAQP